MKAIDKKRILKKLNDIESILYKYNSDNENIEVLYRLVQSINTKSIEYLKYNYDIR